MLTGHRRAPLGDFWHSQHHNILAHHTCDDVKHCKCRFAFKQRLACLCIDFLWSQTADKYQVFINPSMQKVHRSKFPWMEVIIFDTFSLVFPLKMILIWNILSWAWKVGVNVPEEEQPLQSAWISPLTSFVICLIIRCVTCQNLLTLVWLNYSRNFSNLFLTERLMSCPH